MGSDTLFYGMVTIFVILNFFDGHSTYKVISKTSIKNEKNPIACLIFKLFGPVAGIIVLKSILIPIIFLMFYYFSFKNIEMNLILIVANLFYLSIVIHNYNVVKRINYYAQLSKEDEDNDF
jgi:uncharacterized protein YacL